MNENTLHLLDALASNAQIDRADVCRWMADPDLETRALVYKLTDKAWSRIYPELSMQEQCAFMASYLLECMEANRQDEENIHSGFEAAWEFAAWLKHLHRRPETERLIQSAVNDLERLYRRVDPKTRNRIETGAIEHIFEVKALRTYFAGWRKDPELAQAYELCASWGDAHGRSAG